MTDNNEWPDGYPEKLKPISWRIQSSDGDIIAGPNRYYNKHLPYNAKGSELYTKRILVNWFGRNGITSKVCDDTAQYMTQCFSIWYKDCFRRIPNQRQKGQGN